MDIVSVNDPGALAEPPLSPGPLGLTVMGEDPPPIANNTEAVFPCSIVGEDPPETVMLTPMTTRNTLTLALPLASCTKIDPL